MGRGSRESGGHPIDVRQSLGLEKWRAALECIPFDGGLSDWVDTRATEKDAPFTEGLSTTGRKDARVDFKEG